MSARLTYPELYVLSKRLRKLSTTLAAAVAEETNEIVKEEQVLNTATQVVPARGGYPVMGPMKREPQARGRGEGSA